MSEQEYKSKCFSLEEVVAQRSKEIESLRAKLAEWENKFIKQYDARAELQAKLDIAVGDVKRQCDYATTINNMLCEAVSHLKKVCAPESDGIGGFVADEFTSSDVLDARKFLVNFQVGVPEK